MATNKTKAELLEEIKALKGENAKLRQDTKLMKISDYNLMANMKLSVKMITEEISPSYITNIYSRTAPFRYVEITEANGFKKVVKWRKWPDGNLVSLLYDCDTEVPELVEVRFYDASICEPEEKLV